MLTLERSPDVVPRVRRFVAATLRDTPVATLTGDAALVATELVTNAVLHGAAPLVLRVAYDDEVVRIEVSDGSAIRPLLPAAGAEAMTGRGLALVAMLSRAWGVEPADVGKTVWAEIAPATDAQPVPPVEAGPTVLPEPRAKAGEPRYRIELGDVPTDLLLAAKAHVDNLVREFALAAVGEASGSTAEVPAPLAALITSVTERFAEARQSIKVQAVTAAKRGEERTHLVLHLPGSAADAGEEYLAALDAADGYARAVRLLTLESPPEHRVFRRWYVESLVGQLRHAARGLPLGPPQTFEERLLAELGTVAAAQRASDRAARLQSVTAALAAAATAEDVSAVVLSEGVAALGASGGGILLPVGDDRLTLPGAVGYPEDVVRGLRDERRDAGLPAAEVLRTGMPVWIESLHERNARFPGLRDLERETVSVCAVPLAIGDRVLGAMRYSFDAPRLFDEDERRFVLALAAQTAQALERSRLYDAERVARRRADFLAAATDLLTSSLAPDDTVAHVVALVVPAFADRAVVLLGDAAPPHDAGFVAPLGVRGRRLGLLAVSRDSGEPFSAEDARLLKDLATRAAVAVDNAQQFAREHDAALALQHSLLPQTVPVVPGLRFAWRYLPGGAGTYVGGDWYDVIPLERPTVGLVIGDVMGRGFHAAAIMGQLRATARAYAAANLEPADVLARLDEAVAGLEQGQITTAVYGVLDPVSGRLTVASAGHLPPLVVTRDDAVYLDIEPGPPLGAGAVGCPQHTVTLPRAATLLLYTDGLVEDHDRPVDVGMVALREAVRGITDPEELCDRALAAREVSDDDTALLAVRLDA